MAILPSMDWKENVARWRRLSAEQKLQLRWDSIPESVARSVAFEGEPVDRQWLEEFHRRIPRPASLKPPAES